MPAPVYTYLIRESRLYARYADCTAVTMTGQPVAYGSVTGNATTNVVTIPGSTMINGQGVTITNLAGGSGLSAGVKYYAINSSGSTCNLATSQGGSAVALGTAVTSATTVLVQTDDFLVWSADYRDIFSGLGTAQGTAGGGAKPGGGTYGQVPLGAPQGFGIALNPADTTSYFTTSSGGVETTYLTGTVKIMASDDVNHEPLRQTFLAKTYWKFTCSTGPSPLYAEVLEGDIIANTAPNTP